MLQPNIFFILLFPTNTMHNLSHGKMMMILIMFVFCIVSHTWLYMPSATVAAMPLSLETDKLALLSLKEKLINGDPDSLPSWNESLHVCEWQGVTCSRRHMRVSILQLENQDLGGTLLGPTLGNLTFLKKLNLTNINLHGEIPREVGRLKRLQTLNLGENNLHGEIPREVARLKRLRILLLTRNNLKGEVPMELKNCSSLEVISLSYNVLTGKVPSWFGSMPQLTSLQLSANDLVGHIPPSLGNLSSLKTLSLAGNLLEGSITHVLGRLPDLEWLSLSTNNFSGIIPHSLYNLSNIGLLDLSGNQLVGTLPSNLHLDFPNLHTFLIGGNKLTGTLPASISNISELQNFDISANSFVGSIPSTLGSLSELQIFDIRYNHFGSGGSHDLDFLFSLTNCTQLEELVFGQNNLGGVLPNIMSNFSTTLYMLNMANNRISGRIPQEIGNLIGLYSLLMGGNSLQGTIPNSIGKLENLVRLALQENKLSGNIPSAIGNLTMLSEVYLYSNKIEGKIPFTLRYCTKMQIFIVYDNNLSGNIPNQTFGYQQGLVNLDLSSNSLTGLIPSDFGNLIHFSILWLHSNKLSGEIPPELGACSSLTEFRLQRNFFHGIIPSFLGSLRSLKILDLSNNNFSSTIPQELENLTLLNTLNLSFNYLYGEVPIGGVFNNITAISLIGNKDLCGGIPQLNLLPCSKLPSHKHKFLGKKVIISVVVGGVLISFIVFISIYYCRKKPKKFSSAKSLQYKYFRVSYGELNQATNGFSSSNLVGTGRFGSVYKGTLVHFERPIAVKVLNLQTHGASRSFVAECKALRKIKHRNLCNILTCCSSIDYNGEDFKAIVFEFMFNGSLESLLHNDEHSESRNPDLNFAQRLNIALDVAYAVDYLHNDSEEAIVHCDIKPSNVLLDDDMVAHIGDFGLARLLRGAIDNSNNNQASSSTIKGTIGYVPPEYGAGGPISPKGDIYSYGILLLEMLTKKKPTDAMFDEGLSLHKFCDMAINSEEGITEIVDSQLLNIPFIEGNRGFMRQQNVQDNIKECVVSFVRIGVACSAEFPAQRMDIKDVIKELHAIKQKFPDIKDVIKELHAIKQKFPH